MNRFLWLILVNIFFLIGISQAIDLKGLSSEKPKIRPSQGKIIYVHFVGKDPISFVLEIYQKQGSIRKTVKCQQVNLYKLSFKGDLIIKKKISCKTIKPGIPVRVILSNGKPISIFLSPHFYYPNRIP